jgi:quercetin dioxygenase-like cupin family protein
MKSATQASPLKRRILQTFDVPNAAYETVLGVSELPPHETTDRHTHPGPEAAYVLQGSGTILADGQPPLQLQEGHSYKLAPGIVHELKSGPHGIRAVVTWSVSKGRPFASPTT